MRRYILIERAFFLLLLICLAAPANAGSPTAAERIQEEIWALPLPLPMFAYLVRPVGEGPLPRS